VQKSLQERALTLRVYGHCLSSSLVK